ncbi:MAG TPA: type II 3-dehydroquinate dehydratase [Anaeromyxobacteraceae bacterium]|nr:type II 3-dehydroquinate dehydratase [Anaeromyxobacteraceae bacterium]
MILLVNGPNLNLLGEREPQIYGGTPLSDIEKMVEEACAAYGQPLKAIQSNYEGALLDFLQENRQQAKGVIINPGALSHTSYALHDCLKALPCPTVEVHLSNVHAREEWRRHDLVAPATRGQVVGLGPTGYYFAAVWLCSQLVEQAAEPLEAADGGARAGLQGELEPLVGGDYEG